MGAPSACVQAVLCARPPCRRHSSPPRQGISGSNPAAPGRGLDLRARCDPRPASRPGTWPAPLQAEDAAGQQRLSAASRCSSPISAAIARLPRFAVCRQRHGLDRGHDRYCLPVRG